MSERSLNRRRFIREMGTAGALLIAPFSPGSSPSAPASQTLQQLKSGWQQPPHEFRPRTRWWWPGNAVSKEGIAAQLAEMREGGLGGVEIISLSEWYEKGNLPYLSDQHLEMLRYTAEKAKELGMEVALTFGAGWDFGGFWVPPEERSKCLAPAMVDVSGPGVFDDSLPFFKVSSPLVTGGYALDGNIPWTAKDQNQIVAVVAAKLLGDRLDGNSLVVLTDQVKENRLRWTVPGGRWRICVFRLHYTGQPNHSQNFEPPNWCVDHFSRRAMKNYVAHLGGAFARTLGAYFGSTIDSFFADSFEVYPLPGAALWSNDTLEEFNRRKGYDLAPYLPAIWWEIGELTPKIRYDVNECLHQLGKEIYYALFTEWCRTNKVQARIQPYYRFTTELIEGAGLSHRPETEVCTARFETVADPRKAVASGARFYGREIVSAEAYTFLHPERYRATPEAMKRATDAYLRDGVTQLYNHGWLYTEEKEVSPSRDRHSPNRIQPWAPWWKHYKHLAAYVTRCCYLLRQGRFVADALIYSPQATVWSERVVFGSDRRVMPYGDMPKTLVANGYDYDLVNDDLLQRRAQIERGRIVINGYPYRFLILPKIAALPPETLAFIRRFAGQGGGVIALDQLPSQSVGLNDHQAKDEQVRAGITELFGPDGQGREFPGGGRTHYLAEYRIIEPEFTPAEKPYATTPPLTAPRKRLLEILRAHAQPDFALAGAAQSDGLTFIHKQAGDVDVYFVANLQPMASDTAVTFRVTGKRPERWDAMRGAIAPIAHYREQKDGIEIPLGLAPWESTFVIFSPGAGEAHIVKTDLAEVRTAGDGVFTGIAATNGRFAAEIREGQGARSFSVKVTDLPEPLPINGRWKLALEGVRFPQIEKEITQLASWTESADTRYLSGSGLYEIGFDLPAEYTRKETELLLDLGAVGDVAEVKLNGQAIGVRWMQPYRFDVTRTARAGKNHLQVIVTNALHNHVAGLKEPPGLPAELAGRYGGQARKYAQGEEAFFARDRRLQPLPVSGLLGPVRIVAWRVAPIGRLRK